MNFLIHDYSSNDQTEPYYFNTALNLLKGFKSTVWDSKKVSAYDMLDLTQPDIYICHFGSIHSDVLSYLKENKKKIRLILNITGIAKEGLKELQDFIKEQNIDCAFMYHNSDEFKEESSKINILNIQFGADVFLKRGNLNYKVPSSLVVTTKEQIKKMDGSYHVLSTNKLIEDDVDIVLNSAQMATIYHNYDQVLFRYIGKIIPQMFYDCIFHGNKAVFDIDDAELQSAIDNRIKKTLRIDSSLKLIEDFSIVKQAVKNRHTSLHRVKSLLSQLSCGEALKELDTFIDLYNKETP